jgi:lysophospholipase L1-like esterase
VVANLPNPRAAADGADRVLRAADAAGRIVLADMRRSATMNWRGKLADDHFHPNELGYAGIARTFYEAIDR